jgi:hypothetical protein
VTDALDGSNDTHSGRVVDVETPGNASQLTELNEEALAHPAASNAGLGLRAALTAKNYNGRSPSDSGRSWDKQLL